MKVLEDATPAIRAAHRRFPAGKASVHELVAASGFGELVVKMHLAADEARGRVREVTMPRAGVRGSPPSVYIFIEGERERATSGRIPGERIT